MSDGAMLVVMFTPVDDRIVGTVHGQTRRPTLAEALSVLECAKTHRAEVVCWYFADFRDHINIRRCECGNAAIDDVSCRFCRAYAPLLISQDPAAKDDLQARYEMAEREIDRLSGIAAKLKAEASDG